MSAAAAVPEGATPLQTHATSWDPVQVRVTLNLTLNARLVPNDAERDGLRFDAGHVVVLDDFLPANSVESIRQWLGIGEAAPTPNADLWERSTKDGPTASRTFGLGPAALRQLETSPPAGVIELNSRLQKLHPDVTIVHQFIAEDSAYSCDRFVANAACAGDSFSWHVDADPSTQAPPLGGHLNREVGKPLFVSALLYLDAHWPNEFDAETLFLDPPTGTGIFVRPKEGRIVLMDMDVPHRLSPPSAIAGRPRYSLVWKLLFIPRTSKQRCCIARPEWGRPIPFGSEARVEQLRKQALGAKPTTSGTKRKAEEPPMTEPCAKGDRQARAPKRLLEEPQDAPSAKRQAIAGEDMQTDA
jgi:hypothetical protein